jgi:hypothetical protein
VNVSYAEFLAAKARLATASGLEVDPAEVHPLLKPHQRDAVVWAVRGGRRAVFASFGLGKTLIQLEIVRLVLAKLGGGRGLIVCPLGVRQEFARDARMIGLETTFIRTAAEASADGIYLTNYESIRDGKLDPRGFEVISLDEAAILRGFGGTKTFRTLMGLYEGSANYRFVATATPSPNDFIELLAYAAFLDVMDIGQAKTRWFKRDSAHADRLTLHPHMEESFWLWVSSWALFLPTTRVAWNGNRRWPRRMCSASATGAACGRSGSRRVRRREMAEIPDEAGDAAVEAAKAHVLHAITRWAVAGSRDAMVATMARTGLILDIVEAAAPVIAAAERARIITVARKLGAAYPVTLEPEPGSEGSTRRAVFPFADYLADVPVERQGEGR